MNYLSSRTSKQKIYTRNKYSDGLPLTSSDLHNEKDLVMMKMGILLDKMIGSSPLADPVLSIKSEDDPSSSGKIVSVRFNESLPINLEGEIFLASTSEGYYSWEDISSDCTLLLVLKEELVTSNSILTEYGGVNNKAIPNDLIDPTLQLQTSARYQIKWDPSTCSETLNPETIPSGVSSITVTTSSSSTYTVQVSNLVVAGKLLYDTVNKIYLLPIARLSGISSDSISLSPLHYATPVYNIIANSAPNPKHNNLWYNPTEDAFRFYVDGAWRYIGGNQIISSATEPTGVYKEGTIWYNTSTGEFKFYINNLGFVDIYSKLGFVQLQATSFITTAVVSQDVTLPIPIDTYLESDLLRVVYEGAELSPNLHYTINTTAKTVTLLNFTTEVGDAVLFVVTRLVGTSDMKTTLTLLDDHIKSIGNSTASGHLKLSDTPSLTNDVSKGIAATPAALKSVENKINLITDDTTGKVYRLGVNNGLIYIKEEV